MESFSQDWVPITFKSISRQELPEAITIAQALPFVMPNAIKNTQAKFDNNILWVSYDIPVELHTELCQSGYVVYGTKEQEDFIHISLMSTDIWYYDMIQVIEHPYIPTLIDLPRDMYKLICSQLTFTEQLNLRLVCRETHTLIHYSDFELDLEKPNFKSSKLMEKAGKIVAECHDLVIVRYTKWDGYGGRYMPNEYKTFGTLFSKYCKCAARCNAYNCGVPEHLTLILFGKTYYFKEIMNNIPQLITLEKLLYLLECDKELTDAKNSFTKKDKRLMSEHSRNHKLSYETKENASHFHKTNDCYVKYNKDLRQIFDISEWFNRVKDMICGITPLIGIDKFVAIDEAIAFGQEVLKNYKKVRRILHLQKQEYHDKKHHKDRYGYNSSSSDSD